MKESGLGKYVAPTALGAAYALARMGLLLLFLPEQAALFDFNLLFLAGVLLGFTLRPVIKPIFWTRSVGTVVVLLLLLGIGPTGKLLEGMVLGTPMDEVVQGLLLGEFGAALLVALVAPWLLPPAQRLLDWNRLGRRLRQGLLGWQRLLEMLWVQKIGLTTGRRVKPSSTPARKSRLKSKRAACSGKNKSSSPIRARA